MLESTECSTNARKERVSMLDRCNKNARKHKTLKNQSKEAMITAVNSNYAYASARGNSDDVVSNILNIEV